jgi:Domain of unknown function (DUF4407)
MNPFLWLSGADPALITRCGDLAHVERNKFNGFGTTVLIPAVFGSLAAGYAASTFRNDPVVYISAGIVWFFTILAIDRFLVSTLYKSRVHKTSGFWIALGVRLILAVVLGFVISHPLVLLIFNDSIHKQIARDHNQAYTVSVGDLETDKKDKFKLEYESLADKEIILECRKQLLIYEQSGPPARTATDSKNRPCGASTGKMGINKYYKSIEKQVEASEKEIAEIKTKLNGGFKEAGIALETEFKKGASTDYLARTKALQNLTKTDTHVWWANALLILSLVLIDSLLVLLKATTPIGQYEIEKDKLYEQAKILADAETAAFRVHSAGAYQEVVELKLLAKATEANMETVRTLPERFIDEEPRRASKFAKSVKKMDKSKFHDALMLRQLYLDAYQKAAQMISKLIKK